MGGLPSPIEGVDRPWHKWLKFMVFLNGGDPITTGSNWGDHPSKWPVQSSCRDNVVCADSLDDLG